MYRLFIIFSMLCIAYSYNSNQFHDMKNARNAALGNISISYSDGSSPHFLNKQKIASVHFSYMKKYGGLIKNSFVSYLNVNYKYPIYFGVNNRIIDNIPDTRLAWEDNGDYILESNEIDYSKIRNIKQQEIGFQISTVRQIKSYMVGISIKPSFISLAEYKGYGLAIDLSTSIHMNKNMDIIIKVDDIVNVLHWNTNLTESFSPLFYIGTHYRFLKYLYGIEIGLNYENNSEFYYKLGLEYTANILFFRIGMSNYNLLTTGIGFKTPILKFDYAFLIPNNRSVFNSTHLFSVSMKLNEVKKLKDILEP